MKINELHIEALKCFSQTSFQLGDVTLMSGLNSSGKSSVIQGLRMFSRAQRGDSPFLEGYGGYDELRSKYSLPDTEIKISCVFDDGNISALAVSPSGFVPPNTAPITYHLSAARHGPQSSLPLSRATASWPEMGSKGDFVVEFLDFFDGAIVNSKLERDKDSGVTVDLQVASWLQEIAPGVSISANQDPKRDASFYEVNTFRPANAGFGVSYSLPIIVALLGLTSRAPSEEWITNSWRNWELAKGSHGVLLLIENPEAHLHPRAQTQLGRLIAIASTCGIQIVIETQSDYILDGLRIAVKEKAISSESVKIYYLKSNQDASPEILSPAILQDGKLEFWPDGFFDQTLKNRMELA